MVGVVDVFGVVIRAAMCVRLCPCLCFGVCCVLLCCCGWRGCGCVGVLLV